jgi:hypothetical protein
MEERRASKFTERLSMFMCAVAAIGAFFVLADPKIHFEFWGQTVVIDGADFSADLKGAVIFAILIGGWVAVKEYWLGASDQGKKQQESIARIAEQSSPAQAAAVAAATGQPPPAPPSVSQASPDRPTLDPQPKGVLKP